MQSRIATLLIFCKQPRLNHGKQRLAANIGAEPAFNIAKALLECAIEDAKAWPGPVVISPSHSDQLVWAQSLLPTASVIPQPEGNLGDRIKAVDAALREQGHEQIITIGTDAPVLNQHYLMATAKQLCESDVVMSAASDGGVTIMASSHPWPEIADLPWSTERLNEGLYSKCTSVGLSVSYVDPSYDIDHEQDLHKLIIDLAEDNRPARQRLLSLTRKILNKDESYA